MGNTNFYSLTPERTAAEIRSDLKKGLTGQEAARRLKEAGPNTLKEKKQISPFQIFIRQFQDFIIWVLFGAALISGFMGEWVDTGAIIAIVILNACLGFFQEYRAEKSLAALKKLSAPNAKVIRDGHLEIVPASSLVPGELIELEAGDFVPADCRVVWTTANFNVQEASLTGESTPVNKTELALAEKEIPLADRANMGYLGTTVVSGKGRALVVGTGMQTELGKIAGLIQSIGEETTALQRKLEEFSKWLVYLCAVLVAAVFLMEWLRGGKLVDVFLTAVSLAVAAIPEGLPAVVTLALALGVQRMVKRHVLIRKLPSVETLGCATVICSDKTGTLTKNEMTVRSVYADGRSYQVTGTGYATTGAFKLADREIKVADHPGLIKSLLCGAACNGAELNEGKIIGDPTEGALLVAAAKAGLLKAAIEIDSPFIEEIPFDAERKRMTVIRRHNGKIAAFVKGAPDILLQNCRFIEENGTVRELAPDDAARLAAANDDLAGQALRVLAVAYRELDREYDKYEAEPIERDLTFIGLLAMIDPPREEVKRAIALCQKAGIKTVMITGDHQKTAVAIAKELGFYRADSQSLTGAALADISDGELRARVAQIPVYARVSPEDKLRIVRAWRENGQIVAMTGDGVNDAPAVKEADIGVAMGITGTDVTKEVSDMVVTDDNFASIVAAVEEGRGIYDNIKKFVHYLLSCNAGEIVVMFVSSMVGWPVPLLPIHILWVNLVTDGLPALALGMDPVDPNVMTRPPRRPDEPVVTRRRGAVMIGQGFLIAFCSLLAFAFVLFVEKEDMTRARTAAFVVLSAAQLFHSFNCRSQARSLFSLGLFTNWQLILANAVSLTLLLGVVFLPPLQAIFKTEALSAQDWLLVIVLSSFPFWVMEIIKLANRKARFLEE